MSDLSPNIPKKKGIPKSTMGIIGVTLIFLGIIIGVFTLVYLEQVNDSGENLTFTVVDQGPYALDFREHDFVKELMNHNNPTLKQFQNATHWAKSQNQETLLDLEYEILEGARMNSNKISVAEKVMLEIITWSAYPEICESDHSLPNCKFMILNYNQALYERGEITRDEFWLNIRDYVDEKTIAEVEGNIGI